MLWKVPYGLSPRLYSRIQLLDPAIRQRTAGFLVRQKNTNSGIFQYAFTMLCFGARLCFCRRVFLYPVLENASVTVPGRRSPPSDFDFACQLKKSKLEEFTMKKINLKDYYPYYIQDTVVEVPDEVADLLREYKLAEASYILRTYRHKAYFSLDYDASVERDAPVIVLTPVEILEQKEENAQCH